MKIDLHCNLPYDPVIPNAAIGYLKAFLLKNKIKVRNIYWNVLLHNIIKKYYDLIEKYQKLQGHYPISYLVMHLSKYLYAENVRGTPSYLAGLIESNIPPIELKRLSQKLKDFIDSYIEQEALFKTELAGFTMKTHQWILNYYVLLRLKDYNPDIKTVIGGIDSLSQGLEFMKAFKEADFAIWGEGEMPLLKLTQHIDDPASFKNIPNLIYREKNEIVSTHPIDFNNLPDINQYPFPDHADEFKTIKEYQVKFPYIVIPVWGVRSCDWNRCKFCVLYEKCPYRERTPENIVQEIEYQAQKHDIDRFLFVDSDFTRKNREEFYKLLDLLVESSINRKKPYRMIGMTSPLKLDRKSIEAMKKIAFDKIQVGFEATADSLLKKMMKKHRFVHNIQALKLAEEQDLHLDGLNIIRGIPSETEEDVIKSITNLKFLRFLLDKCHLTASQLLLKSGAPFFEEMDEESRKKWDFNLHWEEMKTLDFLSTVDRFEFFGFQRDNLLNSRVWEIFEMFLNEYRSSKLSYTWIEHPDGSSNIQEKGTYHLDKTETDILKFCDTVKTFSGLKNQFPNLSEDELKQIMLPLRDTGLLYVDDNFNMLISVVSTKYIRRSDDIQAYGTPI